MDKKQYNNVIDWTLKHEAQAKSEDALQVTRAICNELGVALPQGDLAQVAEVLATDDYMGWKACTKEAAQEAANNGIPAIGISNEQIVLLAAEDEEQPVANAVVVNLMDGIKTASDSVVYYSYSCGTIAVDNMSDKINLLVDWANGALDKNLEWCCKYFCATSPNGNWCAWFVRQCGKKAGLDFGSSNLVSDLQSVLGNVDFSDQNKPKVGDLAFIINAGQNSIGHVGIVVSIKNGKIFTVEGNMSNNDINKSIVRQAEYAFDSGDGKSWGRFARIGRNS